MNKIAVITGMSYGLGEAICNKLLSLSYKVYGTSRTKPKIQHPQLVWVQADLLDDAKLNAVVNQIPEQKVDILVNNTGTGFLKKTLDYTDDDFEKMFSLNFKIHAKVKKLLFPKLTGGLILNISSLADRYPDSLWGLYTSSKTALNLFFETMAVENDQVKIINILPSYVDTPLQHQLHDGTDFDWSLCMKPDDVANAVGHVIENMHMIETGSRVIVEKKVEENEQYNPEKLWVYSVASGKISKIR